MILYYIIKTMEKQIQIAVKYAEMFKLHILYQHFREVANDTNKEKIQKRIDNLQTVLSYLEDRFKEEEN